MQLCVAQLHAIHVCDGPLNEDGALARGKRMREINSWRGFVRPLAKPNN